MQVLLSGYEIEERKEEYPDKVNQMPVQSAVLKQYKIAGVDFILVYHSGNDPDKDQSDNYM